MRRLTLLAVLFGGAIAPLQAGTIANLIFADGFESGDTSAWDLPLVCPTVSTYRLSESGSGLDVWTVPAATKVRSTDLPPANARSGLRLLAARREFEPAS